MLGFSSLAGPPCLEHGAAAHEIGDPEQPGASRAQHHEPEDHAEYPVVRLHQHGFFDGQHATSLFARRIRLDQLLGQPLDGLLITAQPLEGLEQ